jgi:Domain of unknown function (DUF4296)
VKLKKSNLTIFTLPVLFLLFLGCNKEKVIEEDKLVLIYSDMLIAQDTVTLSSAGLDSLREAEFKKYNVTRELYKKTLDYYNQDSERWESFFDKVIAHVENLRKKPD